MNAPRGYFGQELKVGDKIAMVAKSYGSSYMLVANIHSIEQEEDEKYDYQQRNYVKTGEFHPKVKVEYVKEKKRWVYDRDTGKGHYEDLGFQKRISRVYNWSSAITLEGAK